MDFTGVTEAQRFYEAATNLPPGESVAKSFATPEEANSFRVGLYKVRKRLEDYSVTISISGTKITGTKNSGGTTFEHYDRDGNRIGNIVIETSKTRAEKLITEEEKEILQQAKENGWDKSLTDELLSAVRSSVLDKIRRGVI